MSEKQYYVCIYEDGQTVPEEKMGPMDQASADRVADGAGINLNHAEYHIRIEEADEL